MSNPSTSNSSNSALVDSNTSLIQTQNQDPNKPYYSVKHSHIYTYTHYKETRTSSIDTYIYLM
jgi:hypothetical protein